MSTKEILVGYGRSDAAFEINRSSFNVENPSDMIGIASDHAGFELKEYVKEVFSQRGFAFEDFGTHSEESVDYPDFAHPLAQKISDGSLKRGILICGSGNGISMTANKHPNVRCALCWESEIARLARLHNDANILSMPGRFISKDEAVKTVEVFLSTGFEGGRHQRRIDKINL